MDSAPGEMPRVGADYTNWSNSDLIFRITELERQLNSYTRSETRPSDTASAPSAPSSRSRPQAQSSRDNEASVQVPIRSQQPLEQDQSRVSSKPRKQARAIDPSKYNTRFIALKFAYLGQAYNGFEHTNGHVTPLPTIEEEIYRALRKARLIFPQNEDETTARDWETDVRQVERPYFIDWEGCDYSKCGRTDRGVSAFGQVIGIRVRSSKPKRPVGGESRVLTPDPSTPSSSETADTQPEHLVPALDTSNTAESSSEEDNWDDIRDEVPYIQILNHILPKDIRVLAWCPHPPEGFDARFSCRERRYRYFFTQPAFSPTPGPRGISTNPSNTSPPKTREGWLDIDAMREAARHFVGSHDFRNFCKVDVSKQITNFVRHITHADIEPATDVPSYLHQPEFGQIGLDEPDKKTSPQSSDGAVKVYSFTLHGTAFLWHQVRHMVAILFLVGQGKESPSIVPELLDAEKNPKRPEYTMASDAPLVLWDCVFPREEQVGQELDWVYAGDARNPTTKASKGDSKFSPRGTINSIWSVWRQRKIDELLAANLLDLAANQGESSAPISLDNSMGVNSERNPRMFYGADEPVFAGKYVPLLQRRRMETVEVRNSKYMASKGRRKLDKKEKAVTGGPNPDDDANE